MQRKADEKIQPVKKELSKINRMITDNETKLDKLPDLYLEGNFEIDILNEKKGSIETALADLKRHKKRLTDGLSETVITDEQITYFSEYAQEIHEGLKSGTLDFETKRGIIEDLNLTAVLFVEDGVKKIQIICLAGEEIVNCVGN